MSRENLESLLTLHREMKAAGEMRRHDGVVGQDGGCTGQDGSYLTELLLAKGYTVHGLIRRASTFQTQRIEHLYQDPHDPESTS